MDCVVLMRGTEACKIEKKKYYIAMKISINCYDIIIEYIILNAIYLI
jgi:hypothetical protein